jgi:CBS domain-containing protein
MPDQTKHTPATAADPSLKAVTKKKAEALHPDDSVETAGMRMRLLDTGRWPVAQDSKLVGMVEQKNPDWDIGGRGHDPKSWKVGEIMSSAMVFCYEDEDCESAQRLMDERGVNYLPVVDREMRIIGILNREEVRAKTEAAAAFSPKLKLEGL